MELPDNVIRHSAASKLAATAIAAATAPAPAQGPVVLPGARVALDHDELEVYHAAGMAEHEIVAAVNDRWRRANDERLSAVAAWAAGPYLEAIEQMRIDKMRAVQIAHREQAAYERLRKSRG